MREGEKDSLCHWFRKPSGMLIPPSHFSKLNSTLGDKACMNDDSSREIFHTSIIE